MVLALASGFSLLLMDHRFEWDVVNVVPKHFHEFWLFGDCVLQVRACVQLLCTKMQCQCNCMLLNSLLIIIVIKTTDLLSWH